MKTVQRKQLQELWQQRVNDWQQSGLSQTQWCKQHQLNTHQLGYWKRKYAQKSESKVTPLAIATPKPGQPPKTRMLHINNLRVEATPEQAIILINTHQVNS